MINLMYMTLVALPRALFSALQVPVVIVSLMWYSFACINAVLGWVVPIGALISGNFAIAGISFVVWCLCVGFMNTID